MNSIISDEDVNSLIKLGVDSSLMAKGEEFINTAIKLSNIEVKDDKILYRFNSKVYIFLIILVVSLFAIFSTKSHIFLILIPLIFIVLLISFIFKSYQVIDLNNKSIYYLYNFLGIQIKTNIILESSIVKICNNVTVQETNPNGKTDQGIRANSDTGLFHNYYLSFLLNNGKIYNFISLGFFDLDYDKSIEIAKLISKYWNKPVMICPSNSNLIYKNGNLEISNIEKPCDLDNFNKTCIIAIIIGIIMGIIKIYYGN